MTFHQLYRRAKTKNFTIVWSDFVYWFQLFIIKICSLMDDSTFASRKSSLRAFIWYIYISISPKMSLWFSPLHMYMHNKNAMWIYWISEKKRALLLLFCYSVMQFYTQHTGCLRNPAVFCSASHCVYEHLHAAGIIKQHRKCPAIIQSHYSLIILNKHWT